MWFVTLITINYHMTFLLRYALCYWFTHLSMKLRFNKYCFGCLGWMIYFTPHSTDILAKWDQVCVHECNCSLITEYDGIWALLSFHFACNDALGAGSWLRSIKRYSCKQFHKPPEIFIQGISNRAFGHLSINLFGYRNHSISVCCKGKYISALAQTIHPS